MLYPRRTLRRPLVAFTLLGCVVFFAGYLKDLAFDSAHPPRVELKTVGEPVTITRMRTVWAQTTRTVFADRSDATPLPDHHEDHIMGGEQRPLQNSNPEFDELPLKSHKYRDDGLLEVDPNGPHPIFELMKRAEEAWEAKLKAASTTLEEAVVEYTRRYHREPPSGFDDWYLVFFCISIRLFPTHETGGTT